MVFLDDLYCHIRLICLPFIYVHLTDFRHHSPKVYAIDQSTITVIKDFLDLSTIHDLKYGSDDSAFITSNTHLRLRPLNHLKCSSTQFRQICHNSIQSIYFQPLNYSTPQVYTIDYQLCKDLNRNAERVYWDI